LAGIRETTAVLCFRAQIPIPTSARGLKSLQNRWNAIQPQGQEANRRKKALRISTGGLISLSSVRCGSPECYKVHSGGLSQSKRYGHRLGLASTRLSLPDRIQLSSIDEATRHMPEPRASSRRVEISGAPEPLQLREQCRTRNQFESVLEPCSDLLFICHSSS
jgi:hypothetical protein